jgi:outer membrane scaffolding protein for murein synthesis (MipA/OmpV family)
MILIFEKGSFSRLLNSFFVFLFLFGVGNLYSENIKAEEFPLWELNIVGTAVTLEAYPGADFNQVLVLPLPDLKINHPKFQAGRGGVRAKVFDSDRFDLGLSFGGTLPTKSKEIDARKERDMDDLDPSIEIGGEIKYLVAKEAPWLFEKGSWDIAPRLSVRKATAIVQKGQEGTDFLKVERLDDIGWTSVPRVSIVYNREHSGIKHAYDLEFGAKYASEQNMDFYYQLEPEDFLAGGSDTFFDAKEGLMNSYLQLGYVRRQQNWRTSVGVEFKDLGKAENKDSPFVEVNHNVIAWFIVSYSFVQSKTMVEHDEAFD